MQCQFLTHTRFSKLKQKLGYVGHQLDHQLDRYLDVLMISVDLGYKVYIDYVPFCVSRNPVLWRNTRDCHWLAHEWVMYQRTFRQSSQVCALSKRNVRAMIHISGWSTKRYSALYFFGPVIRFTLFSLTGFGWCKLWKTWCYLSLHSGGLIDYGTSALMTAKA